MGEVGGAGFLPHEGEDVAELVSVGGLEEGEGLVGFEAEVGLILAGAGGLGDGGEGGVGGFEVRAGAGVGVELGEGHAFFDGEDFVEA